MPNCLTNTIDLWFSKEKRNFPWRTSPTPYRVLISEIMLQQTQAVRVLEYFDMWMNLFPSLESLANASENQVIKAWEGLGYYSRARSLHKAAQFFVKNYEGTIPRDKKTLLTVPGIGPYTAGAILSFAFHQKEPAVDANVIRLFRRLYQIPFSKKDTLEVVTNLVQSLLPEKKPWHTMEAFIELGALICQKTPKCHTCPVSSFCESYKNNSIELPPKKLPTTLLFRDVILFISHNDTVLVIKRTGKKIMSGLYEFPFFESSPGGRSSEEIKNLSSQSYSSCILQERLRARKETTITILEEKCGSDLDDFSEACICHTCEEKSSRNEPIFPSKIITVISLRALTNVQHSFTRFRASLYPWIVNVNDEFLMHEGIWVPLEKLSSLPFSSGHKKILSQINVKDF